MWQRLKFRNLKSLKDVNLDLKQLTVLVGPNGAGKSSVLLGAQLLTELTSLPQGSADPRLTILQRFRSDGPYAPHLLRTRATESQYFVTLGGSVVPGALGQPRDDIRIRFRPAEPDDADATPWIEVTHNGSGGLISHTVMASTEPGTIAVRELSRLGHGPAMALSLDGSALARPSYLVDATGALRRDGYGLPSLLAAMASTDRGRLDALEADFRKIVPRARRIRTPPTKVSHNETQIISVGGRDHAVDTSREVVGNRLELEMEGIGFLDGSLISDGTLIALGILALLHSPACPKLLLIDDLDHSLHPSAHRALIDSLRALLADRPDHQILCTTHAPYLLDHFESSEIRVLTLNQQGHTEARSLDDHPEWKKLHGSLSTGEFWSAIGEQWVATDVEG